MRVFDEERWDEFVTVILRNAANNVVVAQQTRGVSVQDARRRLAVLVDTLMRANEVLYGVVE